MSSEIKHIYKEILHLGAKILKIAKNVTHLFGSSGAAVRLADVIFEFLGVLGVICKAKQKFQNFARHFGDFS